MAPERDPRGPREPGTPAPSAPESRPLGEGRGDGYWMRRALEEAARAAEADEVPVGAVVVRDGRVLATGHNLTRTADDPTAHAEMVAIRRAAAVLGHWRLLDCTLYVTLEPCAMCSGAVVLARLPRLVFGAYDAKAGMCGSLESLVEDPRLNHRAEVLGGVLQEECGALLRAFFRRRRGGATDPAA